MQTTITISRRSKNLGFAFTNKPVRSGELLTIPAPVAPRDTGGRHTILRAYERAQQINSGNDWNYRVFIDGYPVVDREMSWEILQFLAEPEYGPAYEAVVEVADADA